MSLEKCFLVLMLLTLSMAMPRIKENPGHCPEFTLKLMSSLGAEPKALKCGRASNQQVKRSSCCGPECDYFIQIMNIDPASVTCLTEE